MPKVSIIVPIYNVEKYLGRCMNSLLMQTLKDIEIIMVDDASPDNCPKMCDEYAKKDNRVKVIHKKNAGLGFARNSGIDIACGEYIAFVDSDDYVTLDAYEKLYNAAVRNKADCVFAGIQTETAVGIWNKEIEVKKETLLTQDGIREYLFDMIATLPGNKIERLHSMSVWHSIYKKSIIDQYGMRFLSERELVSEDIPFQIDFFLKSKKMVLLPFAMYYYCLNGTSLTATFKPEKFERFIKLRSCQIEKLGKSNETMLRINRFFLGYCRVQLIQLIGSNRKDKLHIMRCMLDHPIWKEITPQYKVHYLPLAQAIIYWLTIHKRIYILFAFCKLFYWSKKMVNKRV